MPQRFPAIAAARTAVATSTSVLALSAVLSAPAATPARPAAPAITPVTLTTQTYVPALRLAPIVGAATGTTTAIAASVTAAATTISLPTARSASALTKAMSKIGSPYRWGAAGPSAFDCSGLVSWAYKQVGVALPRSSNAMSRVGQAVSRSQLRPGDLVFFYHPVSHVAMYIGGGKVVHASTSSQPVKISNLADMPFSGARRI